MNGLHDSRYLCSACKAVTFTMLRDGYVHPLGYKCTVLSGQTCRMCRLIVCSIAKLQMMVSCRDIEAQYMELAHKLPAFPAVSRRLGLGATPLGVVETLDTLSDLVWSRDEYLAEALNRSEIRKGNFNQGETIQITAPSGMCDTSIIPSLFRLEI